MQIPTASISIDRQQSLGDWRTGLREFTMPVGFVLLLAAFGFSIFFGEGFDYFQSAYLIAYMFYLSIAVGSLFFVIAVRVTRAGWSAGIRRVAEIAAMTVWPLGLLSLVFLLPALFGDATLFPWISAEYVAENPMVATKGWYLNKGFFAFRAIVYFVVWGLAARYFLRISLRQDRTGDPKLTLEAERTATWVAFLFAFATTFAAFDWLMSLDPNWYSTIFGVWYFAGSAVACFAFLIIAIMTLQSRGLLRDVVKVDHFHDLGLLMFAFTCFWAYISFSQYFLIWYANVPEETQWWLRRLGGENFQTQWYNVGFAVAAGCFVLPFVGLMARQVKRNRNTLFFWACWILVFRYVDIYYIARPEFRAAKVGYEPDQLLGPTFGLVDVLCILGLGAIFIGAFFRIASNHPIVAGRDPRLPESFVEKNLV